MKMFIVIPVYNESEVIIGIVKQIIKQGYRNLIVIDDGSTDDTYKKLKKEKIVLLRHVVNRGKGAAIKTGIEAAKILNADIIVTFDGDGQHNSKDINKLYKKIQLGYDVVLGYREFIKEKMPRLKILANTIANLFIWIFYGIWVRDSQSGFRVYTKKAFNSIDIINNRYEY